MHPLCGEPLQQLIIVDTKINNKLKKNENFSFKMKLMEQ
jgi:hypothetical protein